MTKKKRQYIEERDEARQERDDLRKILTARDTEIHNLFQKIKALKESNQALMDMGWKVKILPNTWTFPNFKELSNFIVQVLLQENMCHFKSNEDNKKYTVSFDSSFFEFEIKSDAVKKYNRLKNIGFGEFVKLIAMG